MTRAEQLKFCKICKEKKFDVMKGIICGLTNLPADFEKSCSHFKEDVVLKTENKLKVKKEFLYDEVGKEKRFANYILDRIFMFIFAFIFAIIFAIVAPKAFDSFVEGGGASEFIFGLLVVIIYYSVFEGLTGKTLAKYITKTKVVNEKGEKPDFETIFVRTLCRLIPFNVFSFLGSKDTGWHDRLSKTLVVDSKKNAST